MRFVSIVTALLSACAQSTRPSEPAPPPDCSPETSSRFHIDRYHAFSGAFDVGLAAVDSNGLDPFPIDAVHRACATLDPTIAPVCYEGVSGGYALAIAKAARAGDAGASDLVRRFDATMTAVDPRWVAIHCRGLGIMSLALDKEHLDPLAELLSPRCRASFSDLAGRVSIPEPSAAFPCEPSLAPNPKCDALFDKLDWEAVCAKLGPSWYGVEQTAKWCAFGVGRGLGNSFPGRFEHASTFCRGPLRGACLAGIGFVATYLYPERIDKAFAVSRHLSRADQAAYFEGVANALQWRARSDPDELRVWIAGLPSASAALANQLREAAQKCGLFDFGDGMNCRWPEVASCIR